MAAAMAVTVQTFIMLGAELQRLLRTGMSGTMASRRRRLLRQSAATFGPRYLAILNGSLRAAGKMDSSGTPISFLSSVLTRFRDTCHRRRRCGADAGAVARLLAAFPSIVCACLEFLLHGDCEHVVFIKAVEGEGNVNLRSIPVVRTDGRKRKADDAAIAPEAKKQKRRFRKCSRSCLHMSMASGSNVVAATAAFN